ncbi:unnamed protein product, partial [Strongylus vulgaris]
MTTIFRREKRQAARARPKHDIWGKTVYFYFDPFYTSDNLKKEFNYAREAWEKDTCVNFTEIKQKGEERLFAAPYGGEIEVYRSANANCTAENLTASMKLKLVIEAKDFLLVTQQENVCESHVGKLGGEQPLILGKGCESFGHI